MLEESPLEKTSQDKNSNKKRKDKLNFQENLLKVLSFTLYFMICTKDWSSIYNNSDFQRSNGLTKDK